MAKKGSGKRQFVAKPKSGSRLRRMTLKQAELWRTNPEVMAEASRRLWGMEKRKEISARELFRIFDNPLSKTRMIAKLRTFNAGKLTFKQLMHSVNTAFKSRIPNEDIKAAIASEPGTFGQAIQTIKKQYSPPGSLVTGLTLRKLYSELRKKSLPPLQRALLEKLRVEANSLKGEIHEVASNRFKDIEREIASKAKGLKPDPKDIEYAEWAKHRIAFLEAKLFSDVIAKI